MNKPQRRGRTSKRANATVKHFDQAWRQWVRPYPPIEQFSADEIEAIHDASLRVLRDIGLK
ncbi:MAG: trimethylamine methyltransferase family protein, partial [Pseudomonadota bacterium]